MKWIVTRPRTVAEDDKLSAEVEAPSIEEAIRMAAPKLYGGQPVVGHVYVVTARVEVVQRPSLPLRSF